MSQNRQQSLGRIDNLANQLGVSTTTLQLGGVAAVGAAVLYGGGSRQPVVLDQPPKNAEDSKPIYEEGKKHWTCDPKGEAYIPFAKAGPGSEKENPAMTICQLLDLVLTR